jgi:hypothetical protein
MVVYMHLEDGMVWVRPQKMFLKTITIKGKKVERFQKIKQKVLIKPRKK